MKTLRKSLNWYLNNKELLMDWSIIGKKLNQLKQMHAVKYAGAIRNENSNEALGGFSDNNSNWKDSKKYTDNFTKLNEPPTGFYHTTLGSYQDGLNNVRSMDWRSRGTDVHKAVLPNRNNSYYDSYYRAKNNSFETWDDRLLSSKEQDKAYDMGTQDRNILEQTLFGK